MRQRERGHAANKSGGLITSKEQERTRVPTCEAVGEQTEITFDLRRVISSDFRDRNGGRKPTKRYLEPERLFYTYGLGRNGRSWGA